MRQNMATISNHKSCYNNTVHQYTTCDKTWEQCYHRSCYNNTVHHYTTCDKTWEQSVTTRAVITTLCIASQHATKHGNICNHRSCYNNTASLHNIRQNMGTICNHRSCYNNTVHHYTTYDKTWEQFVTTGSVITTLCITTQHVTKHRNNL